MPLVFAWLKGEPETLRLGSKPLQLFRTKAPSAGASKFSHAECYARSVVFSDPGQPLIKKKRSKKQKQTNKKHYVLVRRKEQWVEMVKKKP